MIESECEIEYLDEDAEIVQQCFQSTQPQESHNLLSALETATLLVERKKRKKKNDDDDSDYDPSEDYNPPSPPSPKIKKRKTPALRKTYKLPHTELKQTTAVETSTPNFRNIKKIVKDKPFSVFEEFSRRKKSNIRIPDYDDPLCLPVKAVQSENMDSKRLNMWNNVCLEHFKHCDTLLKPEKGETKASTRTVVLRNVVNKQMAKVETTVWSKTTVESEDGEKKSEIFQCILPKYKEKDVLASYPICVKSPKSSHVINEVILTKESHKDGDAFVVYKPKDCISAVYTLYNKYNADEDGVLTGDNQEDDKNMYMKEVACCRVCALCYHSSWRGPKTNHNKTVKCPICSRSYNSVYNILAHFKTHTTSDVKKYKRAISSTLSELVGYHYKCRICAEKFDSIKKLRNHVMHHKGTEKFICEVGNHLAM